VEDAVQRSLAFLAAGLLTGGVAVALPAPAAASGYDLNTLAGKVASLRGTAGLQIRFSAFLEEEAAEDSAPATSAITPTNVLSSPLDGTSVAAPDVTVNQDTAAAPQNETAIAADPNDGSTIVAAANDYVTRTWSCSISGTPCSALGDGYSGTYVSTDGGAHWCCTSSDPGHLGTLIPGVEHLTGGPYDAGGDPAVAWDTNHHVYYAGLGFDRTSAPNAVTVSRGTISGGNLTWSAPTFINPTASPSTLNDKEWIAVDRTSGPFRNRIYVSWTRFLFSAGSGAYKQSPIFFASSSDGGQTFSAPASISGNVLYDQGSRPVVGADGSLYVFFEGSTRLASLSSTYVVKSTDGGATWGKPVSVSTLTDSLNLANTAFRDNSFPAAAAAPNGDLYATWNTETKAADEQLGGDARCASWLSSDLAGCESVVVWSKSTNGGASWSAPARVFAASSRVPEGYPVTQPDNSTLNAPDPAGPVEDVFPAVSVGSDGHVVFGAYRGDVVSPWQTCAASPAPPEGRINCTTLGNYIHNTRLDYWITDGTNTRVVSTHPINTRSQFGGGFIGDYTDLNVGPDGVVHALWTDTNNKQSVVWFYGLEFTPTPINQEDVVVWNGIV
jgi:hypothetical protein